MVKKSKKAAKTKAKAGAGVSCNTDSADGPSGGGATPSSGVVASSSSGTRNCFRCHGNIQDVATYHRRRLASAMIMTIVATLPDMVLAAQQPARAADKRFGSRRARRNQEIGLLDLLAGGGGGGGGFQGEDGINMILDGLYQNDVDVDVDVVGIINQCLVAGKGNMDINCFIEKLDEQIPDFDVKEMAEQMGVGTEPYVPPPALDCPSGETEVKSFQIPVTGEYCAVCIPFDARAICGFSCSCSNGDCGCSLKPPDCPGTLICADGHYQEELPSKPEIGDSSANVNGGADDAVNEIPKDPVAMEGDGSIPSEIPSEMPGNSSTAVSEGGDSAETGTDVATQQDPDRIVDYNVTSTSDEVDLADVLEDAANETSDQAGTAPTLQLPRNDENTSSARKHTGLDFFSLLHVVGLIVIPAASAILVLC